MSDFQVHTEETAQGSAAELLNSAQKALGFIPNLYGIFAESPAALKAYVTLGNIFDETSFTPTERQIIILAVSRFNDCRYCMAAHSVVAAMQKVPGDVVSAIRNDQPIAEAKLEALRVFATTVVEKRGWVTENDVATFLATGYSREQILEVVLGVSFKTLSNYVNHLADTPVDSAFSSQSWSPTEDRMVS